MALETRHANTKKPSINSLLNPQDAGNFPAHIPHHDAPSHGSPPYPGSFHSRTMAWTEETTHTLPSSHAHRSYQSLAHAPPHLQSYADLQSSSGMRSRQDHERVYASVLDRSTWQNQSHLNPPGASYAQQSSAPVYPPERMRESGGCSVRIIYVFCIRGTNRVSASRHVFDFFCHPVALLTPPKLQVLTTTTRVITRSRPDKSFPPVSYSAFSDYFFGPTIAKLGSTTTDLLSLPLVASYILRLKRMVRGITARHPLTPRTSFPRRTTLSRNRSSFHLLPPLLMR